MNSRSQEYSQGLAGNVAIVAERTRMSQAAKDTRRKLRILNHAREIGNVSEACRRFGISREIFYRWKRQYAKHGKQALINRRPCPKNPRRIPPEIEERILYLRKIHRIGPRRIAYYLKTRHGMNVSPSGVYCILRRHGMNRLTRDGNQRLNTQ